MALRAQRLTGKDVLRNENHGGAKGTDEAAEVGTKVEGASEHDAEGERNERKVGGRRILDTKQQCIRQNSEEGRKGLQNHPRLA